MSPVRMAGWPRSTVSPSSPAARTNRSGKAWQSRRRRGLRGTASWLMLLPRLPWWDLVKFHRVRTLPAPAEVNPRAGTERSLPLPSAPSPLGRLILNWCSQKWAGIFWVCDNSDSVKSSQAFPDQAHNPGTNCLADSKPQQPSSSQQPANQR